VTLRLARFRAFAIAVVLTIPIPARSQAVQVFTNFPGRSQPGEPVATPIQGRDGRLYGSCWEPSDTNGSDYTLSSAGKLKVLYSFGSATSGVNPEGLTLGTDGNFYGTTQVFGSGQYGTLYKLTPEGSFTLLHSFSGFGDGQYPDSPPIEGSDGNFYGTTFGVFGLGSTIYKYEPSSGALTTIFTFDPLQGKEIAGQLLQGSDGYLYGVAFAGGPQDSGTVFKISTSGDFVFSRSFNGATDGGNPVGPLIEASDGFFYGMTYLGGYPKFNGYGTIFKMDRDGNVSVFFTFVPNVTAAYPSGGLIQGSDGFLYGALSENIYPTLGSLFRISLDARYEQLYNFTEATGTDVGDSLIQNTNGLFYGSALYGGAFGYGAIYTLDMHLPPFITFVRRNGKVGQSAQILGQGLKGASAVTFNGIPATSFSVETDTFMTAVVPSGATTGPLVVTTPTGNLTSNVNFQVLK
jgi:uncharacterized repeat protein (TIGR03803 family)